MSQELQDEDIDLSRLLARVLRHKALAAIVAAVVFLGAVTYAKFAPKFYQTTTKFIYQSSTKQGGNMSALAALAGFSLGGGSADDPSAYMEDIVKSMDFLSLFHDKEWLIADTTKIADTLSPITLRDFWEIELDSAAKNPEDIIRNIIVGKILKKKYIEYKQDKKTAIISITTLFEDPKLSYEFNKALFDELNNTLLHKMRFKASENRKFIEERLLEVKEDLKRSEEVLLGFEQRNRSDKFWNDPSIKLQESRLLREVTINQELALQLQKQYEIAKIEEARDIPLLDIIESPRRALGPSKPKKSLIMAGGLMGGIVLGLMCALAFDLWRTEKENLIEQISKARKDLA